MTFKPAGSPSCYGDQWSAMAPECAGGPDPAYTSPHDGSHRRERCAWYSKCAGASVSAKQATQSTAIVPVQPSYPQPVPAPPKPPQPFPVQYKQPYQQTYQPQYQQPVQPQPPIQLVVAPPHIAQLGPQQVPMPYQQPGTQMPGYLTVPEPIIEGEHWLGRLLREIGRSIFKSAFHTGASFFDHNPIRPYKTPE